MLNHVHENLQIENKQVNKFILIYNKHTTRALFTLQRREGDLCI